MDAVEQKVISIIAEKLRKEASEVTLDKDIENDLGADSLDQVELVMELEEAFGFDEIPEEKTAAIKTVGDLVAYIKEEQSA